MDLVTAGYIFYKGWKWLKKKPTDDNGTGGSSTTDSSGSNFDLDDGIDALI